jgi:hypothetical protein
MKHNLVEVILEGVNVADASDGLCYLAGMARESPSMTRQHISEPSVQHAITTLQDFLACFDDPAAICVMNLGKINMKRGEIVAPSVWTRWCNENLLMLEIVFYTSDVIIDSSDVRSELHLFAGDVARVVRAEQYFAGVDPADDEDTRLFTNGVVGPMSWEVLRLL